MKNTAQSWFLGGPSSGGVDQQKSPSLLADWNAYAASQDADSSALGFDLEAAVRTTSDKVSGTFNVCVFLMTIYIMLSFAWNFDGGQFVV